MTHSSRPTNISRTFDLAFFAPFWQPMRVTLTADCAGNQRAEINEQPADLEEAVRWMERAKLNGYVEMVTQSIPFAGKVAAHRLHVTLGSLGYKRHYEVAAEVLGRPVTSLAHLTGAELALVCTYAHGQLGLVG